MTSKILKASVVIGGAITGSFRDALGTTNKGLKQIGESIAAVDRRQRLLGQSIQTFARQGRNVDTLRAEYARLTVQSERLRAAQDRLLRTQRALDNNAARRSAVGGQLGGAVAAAAAVAIPVGATVSNAAKFEYELQTIGATANLSSKQVRELGRSILSSSKMTNQATNDVVRGVQFLVAAGLEVPKATASIGAIGRTATAARADIEDVAKASFTLIDSLKIDPSGLQRTLDVLAYAGKRGSVELKDMARVLPTLGAGFSAIKMSGDEAAATMGAALQIARKGAASADEAANNMENFLAKMMSPGTLKKASKNFGVDMAAIIQGAQRKGENPFEAAMMAVMKMTGGDQKKLGMLFEDMQVQNFVRPMIQNWEAYKDIKRDALAESSGTTDRDFARMMATDVERMKAAKNAADRLSKSVGAALSPAVGELAGKLAPLIDKLTAWVDANPRIVQGVAKVVVGLVGLKVGALALRYAFLTLQRPFLHVMNFIARWRAGGAVNALGRFGATGVRVAGVVRNIGMALGALGAGPVALIVGAFVAVGLVVRKYWEPLKAWITGVGEGLRQSVGPALGELGAALAPLKPLWDALVSSLGKAWNWITKLLQPVTMTKEELAGATNAGVSFGKALGAAISFVIGRVTALVNQFRLVIQFARTAWTMANGAVSRVGSALGFTDDAAPAAAGAAAPLPSLPKPARRGGGNVTNNNTTTIQVTQQPGESGEAFAERVAKHIDARQGVARRGRLED